MKRVTSLMFILIFLLSLFVGCITTETEIKLSQYLPYSVEPAEPNWNWYINNEHDLKIKFPANWKNFAVIHNGFLAETPNREGWILVEAIPLRKLEKEISQEIKTPWEAQKLFLDRLSPENLEEIKDLKSMVTLEDVSNFTISRKNKGVRTIYSFQFFTPRKDGEVIKTIDIVILKGSFAFLFSFRADTNNFYEYAPAFEEMINSLELDRKKVQISPILKNLKFSEPLRAIKNKEEEIELSWEDNPALHEFLSCPTLNSMLYFLSIPKNLADLVGAELVEASNDTPESLILENFDVHPKTSDGQGIDYELVWKGGKPELTVPRNIVRNKLEKHREATNFWKHLQLDCGFLRWPPVIQYDYEDELRDWKRELEEEHPFWTEEKIKEVAEERATESLERWWRDEVRDFLDKSDYWEERYIPWIAFSWVSIIGEWEGGSNCYTKFAEPGWNWYINPIYGVKIKFPTEWRDPIVASDGFSLFHPPDWMDEQWMESCNIDFFVDSLEEIVEDWGISAAKSPYEFLMAWANDIDNPTFIIEEIENFTVDGGRGCKAVYTYDKDDKEEKDWIPLFPLPNESSTSPSPPPSPDKIKSLYVVYQRKNPLQAGNYFYLLRFRNAKVETYERYSEALNEMVSSFQFIEGRDQGFILHDFLGFPEDADGFLPFPVQFYWDLHKLKELSSLLF